MARLRERVVEMVTSGKSIAAIATATLEDNDTVLRCINTARRLGELPSSLHVKMVDDVGPSSTGNGALKSDKPLNKIEAARVAEHVFGKGERSTGMEISDEPTEAQVAAILAPSPSPAPMPAPAPVTPKPVTPTVEPVKSTVGEAISKALDEKAAKLESVQKELARAGLIINELTLERDKALKLSALPDNERVADLKRRLSETESMLTSALNEGFANMEKVSALEALHVETSNIVQEKNKTIDELNELINELKSKQAPPAASDLITAIIVGHGAGFDSATIAKKTHLSLAYVENLINAWQARQPKSEVSNG